MPSPLQSVETDFRRTFMRRRPDWNNLAPTQLPSWFRRRLKAIDRNLVGQYVPPNTLDPKGVPAAQFPHGVWHICRKIRRQANWLSKRAVYVLVDDKGVATDPSMEILRMIQEARNLRNSPDTSMPWKQRQRRIPRSGSWPRRSVLCGSSI
jgi:hypothetical protein